MSEVGREVHCMPASDDVGTLATAWAKGSVQWGSCGWHNHGRDESRPTGYRDYIHSMGTVYPFQLMIQLGYSYHTDTLYLH